MVDIDKAKAEALKAYNLPDNAASFIKGETIKEIYDNAAALKRVVDDKNDKYCFDDSEHEESDDMNEAYRNTVQSLFQSCRKSQNPGAEGAPPAPNPEANHEQHDPDDETWKKTLNAFRGTPRCGDIF